MKKKIISVYLMLAMIMGLSVTAYASNVDANKEMSVSQATATYEISQFFANKEVAISKLNEVAQVSPSKTESLSLYNGTNITVETRELQVSEDLTIINTRTYSDDPDNHSVEDSYGLFWGGTAGAGGTLTAYYDFVYRDITSPNHMKTEIYNAGGYGSNIDDDEYILDGVRPTWDADPSYTASGSVTFIMQMCTGYPPLEIWRDISYTHTCEFDSYGIAHMSWFE